MQQPSLTVLMTAYNGMPYIREAVEDILNQTLRDFTFLIINNGSRDGTGDFLRELEKNRAGEEEAAPRLKVVHLESNIGRTPALNRGLELIDTELTAVMDADDRAAPERLARQAEFFLQHPDIDLVGSDITYIDVTGNALGEERFPPAHEELLENLPLYNQFAHSACAFRTGKARAVGGYSPAFPYAQDMALWIAMFTAGSRSANICEKLAAIRVHPGQATRELALIMVRTEDNYRLAQAMLGIPGISRAARQAARLRSAGALLKLRKIRAALAELWQGVKEAPLLLPRNRTLWRRLALELRRQRGKK